MAVLEFVGWATMALGWVAGVVIGARLSGAPEDGSPLLDALDLAFLCD